MSVADVKAIRITTLSTSTYKDAIYAVQNRLAHQSIVFIRLRERERERERGRKDERGMGGARTGFPAVDSSANVKFSALRAARRLPRSASGRLI